MSNRLKNNRAGFTLIELMVVVAVIAIGAAISIPQMGEMIKDYRLRSATRELVSDLQSLKLRAIKENARTLMVIDSVNGLYTTFVDNNPANWVQDSSELIRVTNVKNSGLDITSNFVSNILGFNSRGLPATGVGGTITITKDVTRNKQVILNAAGNIRVN